MFSGVGSIYRIPSELYWQFNILAGQYCGWSLLCPVYSSLVLACYADLSSGPSIGTVHDLEDELDLNEFVPHFQRVRISGEDNTGVGGSAVIPSILVK